MLFEADNYLQLQNLPSAAYLPSFSSCLYWSALLKFANRPVYAVRRLSYWNFWGNVDTVCLSILMCAPSDLVHLTWPFSYFLSSWSLLRVYQAPPCYCSAKKIFTEIIWHHQMSLWTKQTLFYFFDSMLMGAQFEFVQKLPFWLEPLWVILTVFLGPLFHDLGMTKVFSPNSVA